MKRKILEILVDRLVLKTMPRGENQAAKPHLSTR
jgi:hypothetical protein